MKNELKATIEKEFADVKNKYSKLNPPEIRNGFLIIDGVIDVIDETDKKWEDYSVVISIQDNYPISVPKLFETGGKIKREKNWHVNPDGSCCLGPRGKEIKLFTSGGKLIDWMDSFALPFLANDKLKKEIGSYASKEYAHGAKGILEYYQDEWKMPNTKSVLEKLQMIAGQRMGRNQKCFCRSNKKFKHCHQNANTIYEGVPIHTYRMDLADVQAERGKLFR